MKKPSHPKMRHEEPEAHGKVMAGTGKHHVQKPIGEKMGKTPKGRSGGAIHVKGQGGHVATWGGMRQGKMKRGRRVGVEHVAKAMASIK